jgi:hypothetical protein
MEKMTLYNDRTELANHRFENRLEKVESVSAK